MVRCSQSLFRKVIADVITTNHWQTLPEGMHRHHLLLRQVFDSACVIAEASCLHEPSSLCALKQHVCQHPFGQRNPSLVLKEYTVVAIFEIMHDCMMLQSRHCLHSGANLIAYSRHLYCIFCSRRCGSQANFDWLQVRLWDIRTYNCLQVFDEHMTQKPKPKPYRAESAGSRCADVWLWKPSLPCRSVSSVGAIYAQTASACITAAPPVAIVLINVCRQHVRMNSLSFCESIM